MNKESFQEQIRKQLRIEGERIDELYKYFQDYHPDSEEMRRAVEQSVSPSKRNLLQQFIKKEWKKVKIRPIQEFFILQSYLRVDDYNKVVKIYLKGSLDYIAILEQYGVETQIPKQISSVKALMDGYIADAKKAGKNEQEIERQLTDLDEDLSLNVPLIDEPIKNERDLILRAKKMRISLKKDSYLDIFNAIKTSGFLSVKTFKTICMSTYPKFQKQLCELSTFIQIQDQPEMCSLKKFKNIFHDDICKQDFYQLMEQFRLGNSEAFLNKIKLFKSYHTNPGAQKMVQSIMQQFNHFDYHRQAQLVRKLNNFRSINSDYSEPQAAKSARSRQNTSVVRDYELVPNNRQQRQASREQRIQLQQDRTKDYQIFALRAHQEKKDYVTLMIIFISDHYYNQAVLKIKNLEPFDNFVIVKGKFENAHITIALAENIEKEILKDSIIELTNKLLFIPFSKKQIQINQNSNNIQFYESAGLLFKNQYIDYGIQYKQQASNYAILKAINVLANHLYLRNHGQKEIDEIYFPWLRIFAEKFNSRTRNWLINVEEKIKKFTHNTSFSKYLTYFFFSVYGKHSYDFLKKFISHLTFDTSLQQQTSYNFRNLIKLNNFYFRIVLEKIVEKIVIGEKIDEKLASEWLRKNMKEQNPIQIPELLENMVSKIPKIFMLMDKQIVAQMLSNQYVTLESFYKIKMAYLPKITKSDALYLFLHELVIKSKSFCRNGQQNIREIGQLQELFVISDQRNKISAKDILNFYAVGKSLINLIPKVGKCMVELLKSLIKKNINQLYQMHSEQLFLQLVRKPLSQFDRELLKSRYHNCKNLYLLKFMLNKYILSPSEITDIDLILEALDKSIKKNIAKVQFSSLILQMDLLLKDHKNHKNHAQCPQRIYQAYEKLILHLQVAPGTSFPGDKILYLKSIFDIEDVNLKEKFGLNLGRLLLKCLEEDDFIKLMIQIFPKKTAHSQRIFLFSLLNISINVPQIR